jgi:YbbR domain-containing protein
MSDRFLKFRGQIRREKGLILLCFILSFFAWQAIRRNISFPLPVSNIPIEVHIPEGWAVLDKSQDTVDLLFSGSREDIRDLNNETLRVILPVPNPEGSESMTLTLQPDFVKNNLTDAKIVRFNPTEIEIKLDQKGEKLLPVKAILDGTLPEGLEVEQIIYTPATVRVKGAQQQLNQMDNIHTEPIELKNRQTSFKENARIALPQGGRLQTEPERVSVELILETRNSTAVLNQVPIHVLCRPSERRRIDIRPLSITITVKGQQQRIDQLQAAEIFAYVNCTVLEENTGYDLPVIIDLPTELQIIKTEPAAVHVEVSNLN